jgi:ABC-type microcin C transport system permease subunit YejB
MRAAVAVAALWTVIVVLVVLMTPTLMTAPPCAGIVEPPSGCETLTQAANDFVWVTQTRPIVILSVGGYVAIAIQAFLGRRRR